MDQVRAAGLNVIEITAGNYRTRGERPIGGVEAPTRHGAALPPGAWERLLRKVEPVALAHPENDPMEKHDHPTAAERLGDSAAGLGAAATLTSDDAEAIASLAGVAHVASGIHESVRVFAGDRRWFTRLHGTDVDLVEIRRSFAMQHGRFFSSGELRRSSQVVVLGSVARDQLFGQNEDPVGREVTIWNQTFEVVGVVVSTNWMNPGAPGDDEFDAVYTPYTAVHRLLNATNLNSITVTAASSGRVTEVSRSITDLLRERHGIGETQADDFTVTTQASEVLGKGLHPKVAETLAGNIPNLERTTLRQLAATLERSSRTMSALLLAIALVSLIVGAIGISNVMLLSGTRADPRDRAADGGRGANRRRGKSVPHRIGAPRRRRRRPGRRDRGGRRRGGGELVRARGRSFAGGRPDLVLGGPAHRGDRRRESGPPRRPARSHRRTRLGVATTQSAQGTPVSRQGAPLFRAASRPRAAKGMIG